MPRCTVARRVHFNAAHRLHNPAESEAWNRRIFGACNNPNFHGHNYEMDIEVEGEVDPQTGFVVDLSDLERIFQEEIHGTLDHRNLNLDVPWFAHHIPTAENIAIFCWERVAARIPAGRLRRIRLWETPRNYVEYDGS